MTVAAKIRTCTKHRCDLVEKPWKGRGRRQRWPGSDVLVCLACIADAKAKVRIEKMRANNRQRNCGRKA